MYNCKDVTINEMEYDYESPDAIKINGSACENISVGSKDLRLKEFTTIGAEVPQEAVKF